MPGMGELLIILLIVLLIFGAGKLPQIGDSLGRSIRNFKRASGGEDDIEVSRKKEKDKELEAARAKVRELESASSASDDIEDAEVVASRQGSKKKA